MSGIKVDRHKVLVYTIAGVLAAVAAIVLSSKNLTAQAGMGVMYELDAIAMAVIGGVSLSGGRGSIIGTVLGALIFGVIISGFTFLKLDAYYQEMVKGAIIVGAVVLDQWRQRAPAPGSEGNAMSDIILETRDLTKHYGGVHALEDANFVLRKGEHVAIVGDNGAGKSTFVRQITGVEQPTPRRDPLRRPAGATSPGPLEAREAGIETVFQTLALADDLDVPSNLFLGREMIKFNLGPVLDPRPQGDARAHAWRRCRRPAVKIPNLRQHHPQHVGRPAAVRGDRADGDLRLQAHHHGRADGGARGAGDRAGREHHPHAEGAGRAADPDQPQPAAGVRSGRPDRGVPPRPHRAPT